jgi:hypothetical protein
MRGMLFTLVLFVVAIRPAHAVPNNAHVLMFFTPQDAVQITTTIKGEWLDRDVVLSKEGAAGLLAFTKRNVGKCVGFAWLGTNSVGSPGPIELNWFLLKAPIENGIVHLHDMNPHYLDRKTIQDDLRNPGDGSTFAAN